MGGNGAVVEVVRLAAAGGVRMGKRMADAQSGLVRCLGRVFGNRSTVEPRFGRGSCGDRADKGSFRATGGAAEGNAQTDMSRKKLSRSDLRVRWRDRVKVLGEDRVDAGW